MSSSPSPEPYELRIYAASNVAAVLAQPMEVKAPTGVWLVLFLAGAERMTAEGVTTEELEALVLFLLTTGRKLKYRGILSEAEHDGILKLVGQHSPGAEGPAAADSELPAAPPASPPSPA